MIKEKSATWAAISRGLGKTFSLLPLPPNFYTWATLPVAFLAMLAIILQHIGLGIALFILSGLLDVIDGAVARATGHTSQLGAFLDGSLDRFIDFFVIFTYFWLPINMPWLDKGAWITMAIFFAIMPSFEVAYANHRRAVHDPEEKLIWRFLNRGEMYFLMLLIILISQFNATWAGYLLVLLIILSFITTLQTLFLTMRLAAGPCKQNNSANNVTWLEDSVIQEKVIHSPDKPADNRVKE